MEQYNRGELAAALRVVSSIISNCEKMQLKFVEGTSSHTLLRNRIKAMYISKALISDENVVEKYTKEDLIEALYPISSVISKCEKAVLKLKVGTPHHTHLKSMIKAMYVSKSLVNDEINKIG